MKITRYLTLACLALMCAVAPSRAGGLATLDAVTGAVFDTDRDGTPVETRFTVLSDGFGSLINQWRSSDGPGLASTEREFLWVWVLADGRMNAQENFFALSAGTGDLWRVAGDAVPLEFEDMPDGRVRFGDTLYVRDVDGMLWPTDPAAQRLKRR